MSAVLVFRDCVLMMPAMVFEALMARMGMLLESQSVLRGIEILLMIVRITWAPNSKQKEVSILFFGWICYCRDSVELTRLTSANSKPSTGTCGRSTGQSRRRRS